MKLHSIVITILLVGMIIMGSIMYLGEVNSNYGTSVDLGTLENNTLQRLSENYNLSQQVASNMNFSLDSSVAFYDVPYKLYQIGWNSLKLFINSWGTATDMMTDSANLVSTNGLPLPNWFLSSIIAAFVIFVIAIVIYGFFKWKFSD